MTASQTNTLVESELSYRTIGSLFSVYNEIGPGYQERIYQRALAIAFQKNRLRFQEQVPMSLEFNGVSVGRYFLDFLVEEKIIVELKQGGRFSKKHFDQVTHYLRSYQYPLAILANFTPTGVVYRRVLRPYS